MVIVIYELEKWKPSLLILSFIHACAIYQENNLLSNSRGAGTDTILRLEIFWKYKNRLGHNRLFVYGLFVVFEKRTCVRYDLSGIVNAQKYRNKCNSGIRISNIYLYEYLCWSVGLKTLLVHSYYAVLCISTFY